MNDISRTCWKIWAAFDYSEETNPFDCFSKTSKAPGLGTFLYDLTAEAVKNDSIMSQETKDIIEGELISSEIYTIGFAFGYVMGQMFDIPLPEVQEAIKEVKDILRSKQLLPYLPRERKGGSHEEGQKQNKS